MGAGIGVAAAVSMSRIQRQYTSEYPLQITGRCNNREHFPVPLDEAWEIFSDYLFLANKQFDLRIHMFLLMPNHYHLIARDPSGQLSKSMHLLGKDSSKEMGRLSQRINKIWGGPYHCNIIDSPDYYLSAYKYNYLNPVAAGLVERVEDYPWSTLQILLGRRRGCIPMEIDETLFSDVEGTMKWLNHRYNAEEAMDLEIALRKRRFALPKRNGHRNPLEESDSSGIRGLVAPTLTQTVEESHVVPIRS